jgi:hypothetical protein
MWILNFSYIVHKSPPLDPILNQMNPVSIVKPFLFNTQFTITSPYMPRIVEHGFFLSDSLTQTFCAFFISAVLLLYCHWSHPLFDQPKDVWWRIEIMKLLIMWPFLSLCLSVSFAGPTRCTIVLKSLKLYCILIPLYMFRALLRPSSGAS